MIFVGVIGKSGVQTGGEVHLEITATPYGVKPQTSMHRFMHEAHE